MDIRKNRKVKLGSISKLAIKFVNPEFVSDEMLDSYGEYNHKKQEILIQKNISDEDCCKTQLHELCHAYFREAHLTLEGNPLFKDTDEERVVGSVETQVYQFFLDNPNEIAYVFYEILKNNPKTRKLIANIK